MRLLSQVVNEDRKKTGKKRGQTLSFWGFKLGTDPELKVGVMQAFFSWQTAESKHDSTQSGGLTKPIDPISCPLGAVLPHQAPKRSSKFQSISPQPALRTLPGPS
ncbi:MAG: hypothetical protein EB101_09460 [Chitinophagia bacterium]|nr:hypothetical protein [Chitinophagia bacterium]